MIRRKRGFTLVEIMIVVAIIALLAAIAIPNLLRARLNANEAAAVSALKTIASSAISFRSVNAAYPANLAALSGATPPYIDAVLGGGAKQGYNFALTGAANTFTATARPQTYQTTGVRSFFVDESGVIRWTDVDAAAGAADGALQ
ncbi:MAG: prepilin-type N-terminal cleavage/methylation domain-containing protein [Candidatus Omnitrophica bacterium]|nr:prepilin-type N-terminal cleavage/methylation domain-containing protein [Candidatus Omnitrophota bacterium]MDD5653456.1 prepilin-type N-terminal cleavage/methylation domain-containing protein [Candidatus Omnitrophota bacterium]